MSEPPKTYSIQVRIRRVIHEDAFVAVPFTDAVMKRAEDGTGRIDTDLLFAEALRISENEKVDWQIESTEKMWHPIQTPFPEGRTLYDGYYEE